MKSLLILCQLGLVASLAPGDCAFVGIYGSQDDFAVVLMEDAEGEVLRLTEEKPESAAFKANKFVAAKHHVNNAKRGTVLKKADFESDASSLVAPNALTLFTGSAMSPTILCSIDLESKQGTMAHKDEASVVMLGPTDTAQYAGSTRGSKEELLDDIRNPGNWLHDASPRKLAGFSIATVNATMTSTTVMGNMTSTTVTEVTTMTTTGTTTTVDASDLGGGGGSGACPMGTTFGLLVAFATSMM